MGTWVVLADVPDLSLLPESLDGLPAVSFRAETELTFSQLAVVGDLAGSLVVNPFTHFALNVSVALPLVDLVAA